MSVNQQFRFAWVEPGTAFNAVTHDVVDEEIVKFQCDQAETEFATLSIDIRNPRIGLLNPGRKLWAWLSWWDQGVLYPLFFGRLVGIPSSINKEVATLQFLARPNDFGAQKEALAAAMRVLPYYDPVFISPDSQLDPDVVLEGRTVAWHIDRTSHVVSTSDLLVGEDGLLEFDETNVPYDSVDIQLDEPPVRLVHVEAEVPWTQNVAGEGLPCIVNMEVNTLAGKGLEGGWPEAGGDIGGGWHATAASAGGPYDDLEDIDFAGWFGAWTHQQEGLRGPPPFYLQLLASYSANVSNNKVSQSSTLFAIISDVVFLNLSLGYSAARSRKDILVFDLIADSQPLVTLPDDTQKISLKISGNDVGLPTGPTDEIPIGHDVRRSYFTSDRGKQSIQYLIQLARANIILRARAVKVSWQCSFRRAIEFSCRKNASLRDHRLPGGTALGKIVSYSFSSDGGQISGGCTIASCIGYGGSIAALPGDGVYAAPGYMLPGYQFMENARVVLGASDVGFTPLLEAPNDDGLRFPLQSVPMGVISVQTVETKPLVPVPPTVQPSVSYDQSGNTTSVSVSSSLDTSPYSDWLSGIETHVNFDLRSVEAGPFIATYNLTCTELKLPKQIDLEAASS
jgi:hypothetical protein